MKDSKPIRLLAALASVVLLWLILGTLGPFIYWSDLTPIWSNESVIHLHSFLMMRTFSALFFGMSFIWITISMISIKPFRSFIISTIICSFLMATITLLYFPEMSPLHILYGNIPSTDYVEGFSPKKFMELENGMSKKRVKETIDCDAFNFWTRTSEYKDKIWMYSGPGGENHWRYWIQFDEDENLASIDVKYWWD